jgi:hypothetical protein
MTILFRVFFFSQGKSEHVYRGVEGKNFCPISFTMSGLSGEKKERTYVMETDRPDKKK